MKMESLEVVAAIIQRGNTFLATQRGYGEWKDWWEFPGGKVKLGEAAREALQREIREELDIEIDILEQLCSVTHTYPRFHLTMHCFLCTLADSMPKLLEHEDARWLRIDEMDTLRWLPADVEAITQLKQHLQRG